MKEKKFVLRLTDELYSKLKRWADEDDRSVNGQILHLLKTAIKARKHDNAIPDRDIQTP